MPRYRIGDEVVRRKNLYRPCVLTDEFENADDAEYARLLKATWWCDLITNAEWPVVLREEGATAPNRSRLKKKASGWLMALARIAVLNPELFQAAMADARRTYGEQVKDEYPWVAMVDHMVGLEPAKDTHYGIRVRRYAVAEGPQPEEAS